MRLTQKTLLFFLLALLFGCVSRSQRPVSESAPYNMASEQAQTSSQVPTIRVPWKVWEQEEGLRKGDLLFEEGAYQEALITYQQSPLKSDTVVYRIAGTLLMLNRGAQTLSVLQESFGKKTPEEVPVSAALLFGYAYGQVGNSAQSMSWFLEAHKRGDSLLQGRAQEGMQEVLKSLPNEKFEETADLFKREELLQRIIGRVRFLRGPTRAALLSFPPFLIFPKALPSTSSVAGRIVNPEEQLRLAVLLPLSGTFSRLGLQTKRGIEIALEGEESIHFNVQYLDSEKEKGGNFEGVKNLLESHAVDLVYGPLLSDDAEAVSSLLRQYSVPAIVLSKRDTFVPGKGIFRLGITVQSQVDSLLSAVALQGAKKVAVLEGLSPLAKEIEAFVEVQAPLFGLSVISANELKEEGNTCTGIVISESSMTFSEAIEKVAPYQKERLCFLSNVPRWKEAEELERQPKNSIKLLTLLPFFDKSPRSLVSEFVKAFREKYQEQSDFLSAQGFDAAAVLIGSVKRAREEHLSLEQALSEVKEYYGLTGRISGSPTGELKREYEVLVVEGGETQLDSPTKEDRPHGPEETEKGKTIGERY